jgi:hypothetical protein
MICNEILQKERYGNYDELRLSLSHSLSLLANSLSLCSRFTHFYSSQIIKPSGYFSSRFYRNLDYYTPVILVKETLRFYSMDTSLQAKSHYSEF